MLRTERENVPADASSYIYTLLEISDKRSVATGDMATAVTPLLRYSPANTSWKYNGVNFSLTRLTTR
ncbi:MAG: hypothetical protein R2865_17620 [Deinococcales bacterium]